MAVPQWRGPPSRVCIALVASRRRRKEGDQASDREPQDFGGRSGRGIGGRCLPIWRRHGYVHLDANRNPDRDADRNANRNADGDADRNANRNADGDANSNTNADLGSARHVQLGWVYVDHSV